MNTTDYIFIDFPIKNYLYGTQVKEISVRKSLSKLMRFLRKLPIFSKFSLKNLICHFETQILHHISAESVTYSPAAFQTEHSLFRFGNRGR